MNFETKVLICGAGPTGLMMACQLKRFNVDCIVVDEKQGIVKETRALTVQARTLMIYEQMGLIDKVLQEGTAAKKVKFIINGKKVHQISFENLGKDISPYGFLFVFTQDKNEELLYHHLKDSGGDVLWQHSLENFVQDSNGVIATVKDNDGELKQISAQWLVGADGTKSAVRHQLQIPFGGGTYNNIFYVADTHADWPWGHDSLSLCLTSKAFAGLFPMKGENRYRLIGVFPKQFQQTEIKEFSVIQKTIEDQMRMNINFTNTEWFSTYHVHHRCVNNFTHQRTFLAGDAAHVHSPAGGQGMNTGLQDAYNLAWKLAMVINDVADKELLQTYNEERLPVAQRLVKTTDRGFSILTSEKWLPRFFRLNVFPLLIKILLPINAFGRFAYKSISQLAINYHSSALSYSATSNLLKAGSLIPFVQISSQTIGDILKFNGFTIFLFNCEISAEESTDLKSNFKASMQIINVPKSETNKDAYTKFRIKNAAVFLIRPDNYIGYCSPILSIQEIKKYLKEQLCLKQIITSTT